MINAFLDDFGDFRRVRTVSDGFGRFWTGFGQVRGTPQGRNAWSDVASRVLSVKCQARPPASFEAPPCTLVREFNLRGALWCMGAAPLAALDRALHAQHAPTQPTRTASLLPLLG